MIATAQAPHPRTPSRSSAIDSRTPKNVILVVGDDTGHSELTIGRYYLNGAKGAPMA